MSATDFNFGIGSLECKTKEGMMMSVASRTSGSDLPATTSPFPLLRRGITRVVAMIALWHRRAYDRRQLRLMLSTSFPGLLHDTGILCTQAQVEAKKPFWRA
jgi:uncharacterized protein YjiS (DUF1127 family)